MNVAVAVAASESDRAESLRHCIEAIASGHRLPQRILVVDQSGGTALRTALDALAVEVIAQPRLGLSASRNLALDQLSGSILAITDDDCVPDHDWLAAIVH